MLAGVASLKKCPALAARELTADKAAIHDGDNDMPLNGARVAVHHYNIIVVDPGIDHAGSADAKNEARRPVEPQKLDQAN